MSDQTLSLLDIEEWTGKPAGLADPPAGNEPVGLKDTTGGKPADSHSSMQFSIQPIIMEVLPSPGERKLSRAKEMRREAEKALDKTKRDMVVGSQAIWFDLMAKAELGIHNAKNSESEVVELDRAATGVLMAARAEVKLGESYSDVIRAGADKFSLDTFRDAQVQFATAMENSDRIIKEVNANAKRIRENASAELAQAECYREWAIGNAASEALAMVDLAHVDADQLTNRLREETRLVCNEMLEEANIIYATVAEELEARREAVEDYKRTFESHIPVPHTGQTY